VEEPGRGDEARYFGVTKEALAKSRGVSASFIALNRNKRSITIDLASAAGRAAAVPMAQRCDIVVHNFRPGAMTRFGLGYDELRAANPGLIYCEFYSYGKQGPLSHIGANDLALQAHSGLMSLTGEPDRPPVRCGSSIVDLHASLALVSAILAALFHRERTGEGQVVESSLLRSSAHLVNYFYGEYWSQGIIRKALGTANHLSVPNQVFPTADGSVVIIAPSDEMWQRCAAALDAERLDLPRYRTILDRQRHRDELVAAISDPRAMTVASSSSNWAQSRSTSPSAEYRRGSDHPAWWRLAWVEFDMDGVPVKAVASPLPGSTPTATRAAGLGLTDRDPRRARLAMTISRRCGTRAFGAASARQQSRVNPPNNRARAFMTARTLDTVRRRPLNRIDLDGRVAVITGRGIGLSTAGAIARAQESCCDRVRPACGGTRSTTACIRSTSLRNRLWRRRRRIRSPNADTSISWSTPPGSRRRRSPSSKRRSTNGGASSTST
jgi:crotonobetainyl-CoA:carnitine CoA-transferase CaiB-like acyl-CoA transferase